MNDKLKNLFSRRSIRKYTNQKISEQTIRDILDAAMAAPSAVATDPWRFIVIRKKKTLQKIADVLPNGTMIADADVGIIICGDINAAHTQELSYMLQDCSAAIENILLAVSQLGLGACWLGVHPRTDRIKNIKEIFSLPEEVIPISAIAIGYPAEEKEPRTRYDKNKVYFEEWN
ncbi:MAG: nitroreductase family protein [Verrucomicrobiota bacterium]|nr:nitroreductase family protein [Verrucomicrobiota bacterium]